MSEIDETKRREESGKRIAVAIAVIALAVVVINWFFLQ